LHSSFYVRNSIRITCKVSVLVCHRLVLKHKRIRVGVSYDTSTGPHIVVSYIVNSINSFIHLTLCWNPYIFFVKELAGFLKFAPFYGAFLYLGVLGVQQFARGAFQVAYLVGAAAFFLPIIALVAAGP
jgi:hypothetical protein